MDHECLKQQAAAAAVAEIVDGMVLGLGTGSTAAFMITLLGERIKREGLRVRGIPTSERTAQAAQAAGIPLTDFAQDAVIDLAIDGADQITSGRLDLIKGLGGALLREKIVADAARRLVIMADASKLVTTLSGIVPVEVVAFGWEATSRKIAALGGQPRLRLAADGAPYRSDGGNVILDCDFGAVSEPAPLDEALRRLVGVVETGFFLGRADLVLLAEETGVRRLARGE
jgi:ribose 5-phosphate isomerase A